MPYLDYTQGTINLTLGSKSVIGTRTYWLQKVHAGDILKIMEMDETGVVNSDFYIIEKVTSDTQILLVEPYNGENKAGFSDYAIQRQTEQFLNTELVGRQMKILDSITELDASVDKAEEHAINAEISANAAKQYAAEAENSMNTAIEKAEIATQQAQIATEQAEIATEQAGISTEQAETSTEQAGISTEQARIAVETVQNFINNGNRPGGSVIIGEDGKIPTDLIPAALQDIKSYPTQNEFPPRGETGYIYLALDTQKTFLWAGEPANMYVPIDTQIGLAGTGSAETAARSDHNHDATYEPIHNEYVWQGVIDSKKNLDTMFIKDGNWLVMGSGTTVMVNGVEHVVLLLRLKTYEGENIIQYQEAVVINTISNDQRTVSRSIVIAFDGLSNTVTILNTQPWQYAYARDSELLNNKRYLFKTEEEYQSGTADGSITENDVVFIGETSDKIPFAVKSVNNVFPDGAGNINLETSGANTILANPTEHPLFRDANNMKKDGLRVFIVTALYGAVANFPTEAVTYMIETYHADTAYLQKCSVLTQEGVSELWQRFGTKTSWQGWNKVTGSASGGGSTEVKQVVFSGAKASEVKVIPIKKNNQFIGLPIEVLKFVARTGTSVIMGGQMKLSNADDFELSANVELTDKSATLNNTIELNSVTTDECLIDLAVLSQYNNWRLS